MYYYSLDSQRKLGTCDPRLQEIAIELIKYIDVKVICGQRSKEAQKELYYADPPRTKVLNSKHNERPSLAMDLAPYPYQERDLRPYYYMGGMVRLIAKQLGYKIRWGGDWDSDGSIADQTFNDVMHIELA